MLEANFGGGFVFISGTCKCFNIHIYADGKTTDIKDIPTIYEALDAANDWWAKRQG